MNGCSGPIILSVLDSEEPAHRPRGAQQPADPRRWSQLRRQPAALLFVYSGISCACVWVSRSWLKAAPPRSSQRPATDQDTLHVPARSMHRLQDQPPDPVVPLNALSSHCFVSLKRRLTLFFQAVGKQNHQCSFASLQSWIAAE